MSEPESQSAFVELTPDDFPFTVKLTDEDTGEVVWESTITGAGALKVPGFHPRKISTTIIGKDGYSSTLNSAGVDISCDTRDVRIAGQSSELILSCIPYDVSEYPPLRLTMWHEGLKRAGRADYVFTPYPGSTPANCCMCTIAVAMGPLQKAAMDKRAETGRSTLITCMLCSAMMRAESNKEGVAMKVINLGNPDDPNG